MTDGTHVAAFLKAVAARTAPEPFPEADLEALKQLGLIDLFTPEEAKQLAAEVAQLEAMHAEIEKEAARAAELADAVTIDTRRTHSILFHLRGVDREEAIVDRLHEEQSAYQSLAADEAKRQADFARLLVKRSELEQMIPFGGRSVAITTTGRVALRDLTVALYRAGDQPFSSYWTQAQAIDAELGRLVNQAAAVHPPLAEALPEVDPVYLWSIAIGLAKQSGTPLEQLPLFLDAYRAVGHLTGNAENRLLAAEILASRGRPVESVLPELTGLIGTVRGLGVASESAVGIAALLLSGRRADGTYATEPFHVFRALTSSYEAAAILAVVNKPTSDLTAAFGRLRTLFGSWGYSASEDTELASAYLAASDLPPESVSTKMAILARGVGAYLEYPLVGSAILASIPVLEANETLNLLEKAYEILGQRTGEMAPPELITLAIRTIHGVNVRSVNELDPTATKAASYPSFSYSNVPSGLWIPVIVTYGYYHATYSGIGGYHPGHAHAVGAAGFGGGGFGG